MAKIKVKVEDSEAWEGAGEDTGDFQVLPKGYYVLGVKEANPGYSQNPDTKEDDKSRPRVEFVIEALGSWKNGVEGEMPKGNYGNLWDYMTFGKDAAWKRAEIGFALGVANKGDAEFEFDTDEVVGTKFIGRIKHEKDRRDPDGDMRARIAKWLPFSDADADAAFGSTSNVTEVDFGGGDDENPFGAEADAEEEDGGDYYTREGLEAEEPGEIARIAKEEFDLNTGDLVVKDTSGKNKGKVNIAKTKAAVIDAILEAQGVGDNGGEEAGESVDGAVDDESPF